MNIVFIGSMAAGKSYIGRMLAEQLAYPFVDTDTWIEQQQNLSVAEIFAAKGEQRFRDAETQALQTLLQQDHCIIATGGGIIKKPENRELMRQAATVIYLEVSIATQLERTGGDTSRPLLNVSDRAAKLQALRQERDPLYREIAHIVIDANQAPEDILADLIPHFL